MSIHWWFPSGWENVFILGKTKRKRGFVGFGKLRNHYANVDKVGGLVQPYYVCFSCRRVRKKRVKRAKIRYRHKVQLKMRSRLHFWRLGKKPDSRNKKLSRNRRSSEILAILESAIRSSLKSNQLFLFPFPRGVTSVEVLQVVMSPDGVVKRRSSLKGCRLYFPMFRILMLNQTAQHLQLRGLVAGLPKKRQVLNQEAEKLLQHGKLFLDGSGMVMVKGLVIPLFLPRSLKKRNPLVTFLSKTIRLRALWFLN